MPLEKILQCDIKYISAPLPPTHKNLQLSYCRTDEPVYIDVYKRYSKTFSIDLLLYVLLAPSVQSYIARHLFIHNIYIPSFQPHSFCGYAYNPGPKINR